MKAKFILFIIALGIAPTSLFSTLIEVKTAELFKQKKIIALCDHHDESPSEEEQTNCLIKFFQNSNTPYHILIEQASKVFTASQFQILYKLDENIGQARPQINNITLQNIEIRYPAIIACGLLRSNNPRDYNYHTQYVIDNSTKTIGALNFQDILNELDIVKQSLASYYLQHENTEITNVYARHIVYSNTYYDSFKQTIEQLHSQYNSILRYAKKERDYTQKAALADHIQVIFSPLLDLHIMQNILQSQHENIVIIAGRSHMRDVFSILGTLGAQSLYQSEEHQYPQTSTPLEITQGLLATQADQPKSFMETCIVQ